MSPGSTKSLGTEILRSVSRSFYLSIRFLPAQLREPITLAYLLARTTDTVADTAQISGIVRMETLTLLSMASKARLPVVSLRSLLHHLFRCRRTQRTTTPRVITRLPGLLGRMEHADRNDIRLVLEKITRGQMLDLQRFDNPQEIRALSTAAISTNTPIWLPVVSVSFGRDSVSGTFASSRAGPKTRCLLWESVTAWRFN